jgi:hypothetical protein
MREVLKDRVRVQLEDSKESVYVSDEVVELMRDQFYAQLESGSEELASVLAEGGKSFNDVLALRDAAAQSLAYAEALLEITDLPEEELEAD